MQVYFLVVLLEVVHSQFNPKQRH